MARDQEDCMEHFTLKTALKPSESVREIESQDGAVLLDIRQGLCLGMTPVALMIWHRLKLNETGSQIADYLAAQFRDVSPRQIQSDVADLLSDLGQKGLLIPSDGLGESTRAPRLLAVLHPPQRRIAALPAKSRRLRFLVWKALFGLLAFDLFGYGANFSRIHASVQTWPIAAWFAPSDAIDRVCQAINWACVWYPKRIWCLQRSAVLTCLLRSCGVPARMVMGAQKFPFAAHAWTEVDGCPINERRDVQKIYLVWERC